MPKEFILPEFSLSHQEKKEKEKEYFGGYEEFLCEKSWEKRAKESIEEIEKAIDEGLERKKRGEGKEKEEKEEEIKREILYSSKGGYIVKVSKKEDDKTVVNYYLVTKIDDLEEAIDKISSYKPIVER